MSKNSGQKLKLMYLSEIFMERTDENHALTMSELLAGLEETVKLRFADRLIGVVVDRYGQDVFVSPHSEFFLCHNQGRRFTAVLCLGIQLWL